MNKKLVVSTLLGVITLGVSTGAWAHPQYMFPARAISCSDCHIGGSRSKEFVAGILEAFPVDQSLANPQKILAIQGLTDAQRAPSLAAINAIINPPPTSPDTKPVLSSPTTTWDVTVGEGPINVLYSVADAELDTFTVNGTGMTVSPISLDEATQQQNFALSWTPSAVHAGQTYPINVYVREDHRSIGRFLSSNMINSTIKVWPARANAATAQVGQFALYDAQWQSNTLTLSGHLSFKDGVTAEQQAQALASLPLNLSSAKGKSTGMPAVLLSDDTGAWTATVSLKAKQVPCSVIAEYEGLKAQRPVTGAPAKCVK